MLLLSIAFCFGFKSPGQNKPTYKSKSLIIKEITPNIFQHISYLEIPNYGPYPCNGMIFRSGNEVIVFDTPTTDSVAKELIQWLRDDLKCEIKAVVINHFHEDCLGGLAAFHAAGIPSYAQNLTIELAQKENYELPQNGWKRKKKLKIGKHKVLQYFLGEGHTLDNIVSYVPSEKALFGGCLIKSYKAKKGYLGDANPAAWSETVAKVKAKFPHVEYVIPGHLKVGGSELLDYTIELFQVESPK